MVVCIPVVDNNKNNHNENNESKENFNQIQYLRDDTSKKIGNENYLNIGGAFNNL